LDVKSLYPTMMITNNISFDTVNCECCKVNMEAKVEIEIMDIINLSLAVGEKREHYWICKDPSYRGIVSRLLRQFRDERFRQQEFGNEPMQLALKNLINGCYGLFGTDFFPFADYRVAELTTAYGRQTLQYMQHIAKEVYGLDIIYGDTDSIFVTDVKKENDIIKFIAECSILIDIDVEISDIYKKFLIENTTTEK
jgi:DNA polymerase I